MLDGGPTELTNVVRAALGQIEGFQRVGLRADTEVMVEPDIIGDLTLMVAELLENAVSFSPAGSPVEVVVRTDGDDALIVVADHGLGMSAERIAEENARLIRRERLDLVPTKVLGLFVVGTLARRWDIDVTLARTPGGGVTAEITIPATLLLRMSALASTGAAGGGYPSRGPGRDQLPTPAPVEPAPVANHDHRPAPSWATSDSGPRPAITLSTPEPVAQEHMRADEPAPLPRRVSRYDTVQGRRRDGTGSPHSPVDESADGPDSAPGGSRPLRRRVRGPPFVRAPTTPPSKPPGRPRGPPTRTPSARPSRSSRPPWSKRIATATPSRACARRTGTTRTTGTTSRKERSSEYVDR